LKKIPLTNLIAPFQRSRRGQVAKVFNPTKDCDKISSAYFAHLVCFWLFEESKMQAAKSKDG